MLDCQRLCAAIAWRSYDALTSESPRAYRLAGWSCVALALMIGATISATGCSPQLQTVRDTLGPALESGWRTYCGQRPHTDFYVSSGAVYCWLLGLAMCITGPNAHSLAVASLLPLAPLGWYAWQVSRRRLPAGVAFLVTAEAMLLLTATRPLGWNDSTHLTRHALSYAMQYNRIGWAFLMVLAFQCMLAPNSSRDRNGSDHRALPADLFAGIVAGLLFFIKVTYGAAAIVLLLVPICLGEVSWQRVAARFAGWAMTVAACFAAIGSVTPFFTEQAMMAAAAPASERLMMIPIRAQECIVELAILPLMIAALAALLSSERVAVRGIAWWRELFALSTVTMLGLIICASNTQHGEIPLFTVAAIIFAEACRRWLNVAHAARSALGLCWAVVFLSTVLALSAATTWNDAFSIGYSYYWKHRWPEYALHIDVPSLEMMAIEDTQRSDVETLQDGLKLLAKHDTKDARVMSFTNFNPFPFALGLPSPVGGSHCFQLHRIVSDRWHPPAERVMGEVTHVMCYHYPADDISGKKQNEFMERAYGDYLRQHFHRRDESRYWTLWVRNEPR